MAAELSISYESGNTVYAIIRRESDAKVWQTTTETFVTWNSANIANYDVALTDQGGDYYSADFPDEITGSGNYAANYYVQATATPDTTDDLLDSETIYWNGAASAGGPIGGNTITIGECVTLLRVYCRNEGETDDDETVYSLEEKHLALQTLLGRFARDTRCIQTISSFTITDSDADIDLSSITGFNPERYLKSWINSEDAPLDKIEADEINSLLANDAGEGLPSHIAFDAATGAGRVWPTPNDGYTGKVKWWAPLTGWTAGDTGVANTELNIPADQAREAIRAGAIYYLQGNEAEHAELAAQSKVEFELCIRRYSGSGNYGGDSVRRGVTYSRRNSTNWRTSN